MPLLQQTNATLRKTRIETPPLSVIQQNAPEAESETILTVPEEARRVPGRYSVSWANMAATLKPHITTVIAYAFIIAFGCAIRKFLSGKPVEPSYIVGEALRWVILLAVFTHITHFKGRTLRAWMVSGVFRFTMAFAMCCVLDAARSREWATADNLAGDAALACLVTAATLLWQVAKKNNRPKTKSRSSPTWKYALTLSAQPAYFLIGKPSITAGKATP